jgi:hypothetical protein
MHGKLLAMGDRNPFIHSFIHSFRPVTAAQMDSVRAETYDMYSNQLLASSYCTSKADSTAYPEDPEGDGTYCMYYPGSNVTTTCTQVATSSSWRRFCPCSIGKSVSTVIMLRFFILNIILFWE